MSFHALFTLLIASLSLGFVACTKVDSPKDQSVQYGGACSEDYSREYERILNLSKAAPDLLDVCNDFYARYSGVKCFSHVDGTELRIHTSDFDNKCKRGISSNKSKSGAESTEPPLTPRNQSTCSNDLIDFIIAKQREFNTSLQSMENGDVTDDFLFENALASKKACNQYFFNYKYLECSRDGKVYSFYHLKPYCDVFQNQLHSLKNKNSKKYSPQELKPVTSVNLKFHFEDSLIPFYTAKAKIKDSYFVDGQLLDFSQISSNQNYCYFESAKLRFSGELQSEMYKVDVTIQNKNRVVFTHTSFNEQWRFVCHTKGTFYHQDLLEVLGDKVTVLD